MEETITTERTITNKVLMVLNIAFQSLTPLLGVFFVIYVGSIFEDWWREIIPIGFLIAWLIYFVFIIMLNIQYFPTKVRDIAVIILSPLFFGVLSTFRHGSLGLVNFIMDTGFNIYMSVVLIAILITYFGSAIATYKKRRAGNKNDFVWKNEIGFLRDAKESILPLLVFFISSLLGVVFLIWINFRLSITPDMAWYDIITSLVTWLVSLIGTMLVYYKRIMSVSIFAE